MGTETLLFRLFEPEKNVFKDGYPTFKIMTKGSYFLEQFFGAFWLMFKYISFSFFLQFCSEFYLALCFIGYSNEQGVPSLKTSVKTPKEFVPKNNSLFVMILKVFKHFFLRLQESKWQSFSAHQKENYMQIPKLTLLLFLVPFLWELWPFKTWGRFFWDTL